MLRYTLTIVASEVRRRTRAYILLYTGLTAFARENQSSKVVGRTVNERRTAYSPADNVVIPTPTSLTSIVPCGAWIVIVPIRITNAISWSYAICTIKNCSVRALTSRSTTS